MWGSTPFGAGGDPGQHGAGDHLRADPERAVAGWRRCAAVGLSAASSVARRRPGPAAPAGAAAGPGFRPGPAAPCRSASPPGGGRGRACRARRRCSGCRRCLRGRRTCRARGELPSLRITPSLTATTGAPSLGEDVDPAPGRRGGDDFGGVAEPLSPVDSAAPRGRRCRRRSGRRRRSGSGRPRSGRSASRPGRRAACRRRGRRASTSCTYQSAWL